jgi:putative serine protease PepD
MRSSKGLALLAVTTVGLGMGSCTREPDLPDPPATEPPAQDVLDSVRASVVTVQNGQSSGSGLVLAADGHVLTSLRLAADAAEDALTVSVEGGNGQPAAIVGSDPRTQLAVVKMEGAAGLTPVVFGDSDALAEGDEAMTLSGPADPAASVTTGTVQDVSKAVDRTSMIEISVATDLTPGGVVVNQSGEVIAIVVGTGADEEGAEVSLAIPANLASRVADQLVAGEPVAHPFLGVSVDTSPDGGALVEQVPPGSPAEQAGLQPGDIISSIGDRPVGDADDVVAAVQSRSVGDDVTVTYTRDGSEQEVTVTLGQAPAENTD